MRTYGCIDEISLFKSVITENVIKTIIFTCNYRSYWCCGWCIYGYVVSLQDLQYMYSNSGSGSGKCGWF